MILQQPPPLPAYQIHSNDESHLKIISVCHYVMAGLYLLGIGFVIFHFMIMSWFMGMAETDYKKAASAPAPLIVENTPSVQTGEISEGETSSEGRSELLGIPAAATATAGTSASAPFPKEILSIFKIFYVIIGTILVALSVCNSLSGHYINKRRNKLFSYIIAGINCMQFPLGTTLGVFTFIVLSRESVKMAYRMNLET